MTWIGGYHPPEESFPRSLLRAAIYGAGMGLGMGTIIMLVTFVLWKCGVLP